MHDLTMLLFPNHIEAWKSYEFYLEIVQMNPNCRLLVVYIQQFSHVWYIFFLKKKRFWWNVLYFRFLAALTLLSLVLSYLASISPLLCFQCWCMWLAHFYHAWILFLILEFASLLIVILTFISEWYTVAAFVLFMVSWELFLTLLFFYLRT